MKTNQESVPTRPQSTRDEILAQWPVGGGDPLLSFKQIVADLGISRATFHRSIRHQLPVLQISAGRFGVRRSDFEAWKSARRQAGVA